MFIQSRNPQPAGVTIRFEVVLQDGTLLLRGEGKVIWIKEYDADKPTQAHGMGIRFHKLTKKSRKMIVRLLAHKKKIRAARASGEAVAVGQKAAKDAAPAAITPVEKEPAKEPAEEPAQEPEAKTEAEAVAEADAEAVAEAVAEAEAVSEAEAGTEAEAEAEAEEQPPAHEVEPDTAAAESPPPDHPAKSNGVGALLVQSDATLAEIITSASITEDQLADVLVRALSRPPEWLDIEELSPLLDTSPALQPDMAQALEVMAFWNSEAIASTPTKEVVLPEDSPQEPDSDGHVPLAARQTETDAIPPEEPPEEPSAPPFMSLLQEAVEDIESEPAEQDAPADASAADAADDLSRQVMQEVVEEAKKDLAELDAEIQIPSADGAALRETPTAETPAGEADDPESAMATLLAGHDMDQSGQNVFAPFETSLASDDALSRLSAGLQDSPAEDYRGEPIMRPQGQDPLPDTVDVILDEEPAVPAEDDEATTVMPVPAFDEQPAPGSLPGDDLFPQDRIPPAPMDAEDPSFGAPTEPSITRPVHHPGQVDPPSAMTADPGVEEAEELSEEDLEELDSSEEIPAIHAPPAEVAAAAPAPAEIPVAAAPAPAELPAAAPAPAELPAAAPAPAELPAAAPAPEKTPALQSQDSFSDLEQLARDAQAGFQQENPALEGISDILDLQVVGDGPLAEEGGAGDNLGQEASEDTEKEDKKKGFFSRIFGKK